MKYDISNQFGLYAKFIPPFGKTTVGLWGGLIKNSYKVLKDDKDVSYEKIEFDDFCIHFVKPKGKENLPCLLFVHGGAFVFSGYKSHYKVGLEYLKGCESAIAFVDYRLAPKHPFPAGENDCKRALDWLFDNADGLSVDKSKIGIVGDSAGGNLSAKLSAYAKTKGYSLCCQAFIYPVVDPELDTESKKIFTDTPMWNSVLNEKMWNYYFGGKDYLDAGYEKILSEDFVLSDCPTFLEVCEYDCLRGEGLLLCEYLIKNGVAVECVTVKNAMHGFDVKECEITKNAIKKRVDFFNRNFKNT